MRLLCLSCHSPLTPFLSSLHWGRGHIWDFPVVWGVFLMSPLGCCSDFLWSWKPAFRMIHPPLSALGYLRLFHTLSGSTNKTVAYYLRLTVISRHVEEEKVCCSSYHPFWCIRHHKTDIRHSVHGLSVCVCVSRSTITAQSPLGQQPGCNA